MSRSGFSLLLLLFLPFNLLAQSFTPNPDWRFENFDSKNHFISREVPDLTMDKHGYLWTCSEGVQRFDGYKTVEFNSFSQVPGSLRGNYTDVAADNTGRIWVSSLGLCYYDDASGKFVYIKPDAKHHITYTQGFCFHDNYLWFVCDCGLAKLDLRSLKLSFTSLTNVTDPLGTYLINDHTLLISSREKVYTYNINNNTYSANTLIYKHLFLKIFALTRNDSSIFLATNRGLFLYKNLYDVSLLSTQTRDMIIEDMVFLPQDKKSNIFF